MAASPSTLDSAAPPWQLIHFDVHCARCGHDLRGQSDPLCPACNLEFSWEQAIPLEHLTCGKCGYHLYGLSDSRCPECGHAVDWNEALLRYRRREKPLFEYRWRDRPIRSFFRTWLLALRPKRLWHTVEIHDPPQVIPLLAWLFTMAIVIDLAGISIFAAIQWILNWIEVGQWPGGLWITIFTSIANRITNWTWHMPMSIFLAWAFLAFAALMVFRQSMRRAKVRTVHVVRVWVYAAGAALPFTALGVTLAFIALEAIMTLTDWSFRRRNWWLYDLIPTFGLISLIHSTWSLRCGYKFYLRIPHSLSVALAAQLLAGLSVAILWLRLFLR